MYKKKLDDYVEMAPIEKDKLCDLFQLAGIRDQTSLKSIQQLGGDVGIAEKLQTNIKNGLDSSDRINQLKLYYGTNQGIDRKMTSLWSLIMECLSDTMLQVLLVAALFSTIIGVLQNGFQSGWTEGATIFLAVFIIVTVTTINNYIKERQFRNLQRKIDESYVQVIRCGKVRQLDVSELVVGDIVNFNIGDIFPVDGIMLSGSEVKVDESSMTGETIQIRKVNYQEALTSNKNSFLISGTKVDDGTGTMMVLAVGKNSCQGKLKQLLEVENPPTPLQQKLEGVAEDIGKLGTAVAILVFIAISIHILIKCFIYKSMVFLSLTTLSGILNGFMIGITIIVVAVPEGLPLAVTIALAFSVNKMKDEQNLVKNLASCEIMGGANEICSDKTGTLTQNQMTVVAYWMENQILKNEIIYTKQKAISKHTLDLFAEAICYNSSVYPFKSNLTGRMMQIGNKTECALIELCDDYGYNFEQYRPNDRIFRVVPFNSKRKKMFTIVFNQRTQNLRVYAKGASEIILSTCTKLIGNNGSEYQLNTPIRNSIKSTVIDVFANQSLRTIAIAYKELTNTYRGQIDKLKALAKSITEEELENDLVLISICGIKDPIRKDVHAAIAQCAKSKINVRMVTGDNLLTAISIAKECGILKKEFVMNTSYEVMEGKRFKELIKGSPQKIENMEMFSTIISEMKVLARATPEDKFILVSGLIKLGNVVAVTGDGANDAPALKKADVGFAMGISGQDVSKEAADIILLDDNFSSIITACKWGRNIYNCIRKFIQFQLTVNVVALFMAFLGAIVLTQSPLNAIQMLWVNLIMDTFASLALATEPPSQSLLNAPPYSRFDPIVSPTMYRFIFCQSLYQITILNTLLFILPRYIEFQSTAEKLTFFFHTFVLLQVCNSVSSRQLSPRQFNPFKNICNNCMFWVVQIITLIVQYLLIQYGGVYVQVVPLNLYFHIASILLALSSIVFGILFKLIPSSLFDRIQLFKETEIEQMDSSICSRLRKKSTIRMHSK